MWVFVWARMGVKDDEEVDRGAGDIETCNDFWRTSDDDAGGSGERAETGWFETNLCM